MNSLWYTLAFMHRNSIEQLKQCSAKFGAPEDICRLNEVNTSQIYELQFTLDDNISMPENLLSTLWPERDQKSKFGVSQKKAFQTNLPLSREKQNKTKQISYFRSDQDVIKLLRLLQNVVNLTSQK